MVKTNTTILREGRQFEVDADTVTTGTLTDSDDDAAWETLRKVGYESGDFLPLVTSSSHTDVSTSSSSYSAYRSFDINPLVLWNDIVPSSATPQIAGVLDVNPASDEIDVKIRSFFNGNDIVEKTGITGSSQRVTLGPTDFTPPSRSTVQGFIFRHRNNDNSTSVTTNGANLLIGVKL